MKTKPTASETRSLALSESPVLSCLLTEQTLLGGLLLKPEELDTLERLKPIDFYHPAHQVIFEQLSHSILQNKTLDPILFMEQLKKLGKLDEVGGETYLWELANQATGLNLVHYASVIREKSILRKMMRIGQSITEKAISTEASTLDEKLEWMESQVFNWRDSREQVSTLLQGRTLYATLLDHIHQAAYQELPGHPTGFSQLDQLTLGLRPEQLVILAARPSMGKTTLALNMAAHVAEKEPVLFFSLETPAQDLMLKVVCAHKKLSLSALQQGKITDADGSKLMAFFEQSLLDHLFIEEPHRLSLTDLRSRLRRFIRQQGNVGLVVVDYLQLMSIPGYGPNQRVAEISEISRGLKALAREFKVPVLALSQLNRDLERRTERRPIMADLRESGSIEQDADLILFIYRDEVYHSDSPDKGMAEIIVAKNRNGQIGKVNLAFEAQYGLFKESHYIPSYLR